MNHVLRFNKTAEEVVAAAREQARAKAAKVTESKGMNFASDECVTLRLASSF